MLAETLCDLGDWFCHLTLEKKQRLLKGKDIQSQSFQALQAGHKLPFVSLGSSNSCRQPL